MNIQHTPFSFTKFHAHITLIGYSGKTPEHLIAPSADTACVAGWTASIFSIKRILKPFSDLTVIMDTGTKHDPYLLIEPLQSIIEPRQKETQMPTNPEPTDLLEPSRTIQRPIDERSWRRYQRYLRILVQRRANTQKTQPPAFEGCCNEQQNQENSKIIL